MPEGLDELLARHHDGDLDDAGLQRLVAKLEADPAMRALYRRELLLTAALRQEASLRSMVPVRRRWWRWVAVGSGLAAAALAAALLLWPASTPERTSFNGAVVAVGDRLRGPGELQWPDGSLALLDQEAELLLGADEPRAELLRGGVSTRVAHQPPGSSFAIGAGPVLLRALGTRFVAQLGPADLRVEVDAGVVAVEDRKAPGLAQLLFAGDAWRRDLQTGTAEVTTDETARDAARAAGRVDAELIADFDFDKPAGSTVRDRTGGGMDLTIAAGASRWTPAGLSITGRRALRWEGDPRALRNALERGGVTIEIAWDGAAAPGAMGSLLELRCGDGEDETITIGAEPADTLHHLVLCFGTDGASVFTDGSQITRLHRDAGSSARFAALVRRKRMEILMQGIAHPKVDERTMRGERSWQVTFRRVTIHGRVLTAEEVRRNALADEAERLRRR